MERINEHLGNRAEYIFDVEMTNAIKGAAICIMLFHHFFGFPSWLNKGVTFYGIPFGNATIEYYLAVFGKICIAMYTVLSGYGLFISYHKKEKVFGARYLVKKTVQLLINWWLVILIVELPIIIFWQIDGGLQRIVGHMILTDFTGNPFVGSYLIFYLIALWTSPFWYKVVSKCKWEKSFIIILPFVGVMLRKAVSLILGEISIVNTYILYIPYFLTGMMICKSQLYQKIYDVIKNQKLLWLMTGTGCVILIIMRSLVMNHALSFDGWFAGILIFLISVWFQNKVVRAAFAWLGKYSTNLWYSHAVWIFCGVTMQQILYAPKFPIVILGWGILLCVPGAIIVSWGMKRINVMKAYLNSNLIQISTVSKFIISILERALVINVKRKAI